MKQCFKCGCFKQISEYYKHPMMADGHLGKCKECTKQDTFNRVESKKLDPNWVIKERARCREKAKRSRMLGTHPKTNFEAKKNWEIRNKHKKVAQQQARRAFISGKILSTGLCEDCGVTGVKLQMHHEDYSKPLDVNFLCTSCHGKRHWKKDTTIKHR